MTLRNLASLIDHTALKPETVVSDIERLCAEKVEYGFATVCVMPWWVGRAARILAALDTVEGSICTVVGFPIGAHRREVKRYEAEKALEDGAAEIDMVMNIGAFLSGETGAVAREIEGVANLLERQGGILKVIIETGLLSAEQIVEACRVSAASGADFVKTSTGFGPGGATIEAVRLMRATLPGDIEVKASGGIRTREDALGMIQAGATRIGASSSVALVSDK